MTRAHDPQQEKPPQWEARAPQGRVALLTATRESPHTAMKTQGSPPQKKFYSFIFKSVIHFDLIFVYDMKFRWRISYFAFSCPIASAPFAKKAIISPLNWFCSFVKNLLGILVWIYFWVSILFYWSMCLSLASSILSWLLPIYCKT